MEQSFDSFFFATDVAPCVFKLILGVCASVCVCVHAPVCICLVTGAEIRKEFTSLDTKFLKGKKSPQNPCHKSVGKEIIDPYLVHVTHF